MRYQFMTSTDSGDIIGQRIKDMNSSTGGGTLTVPVCATESQNLRGGECERSDHIRHFVALCPLDHLPSGNTPRSDRSHFFSPEMCCRYPKKHHFPYSLVAICFQPCDLDLMHRSESLFTRGKANRLRQIRVFGPSICCISSYMKMLKLSPFSKPQSCQDTGNCLFCFTSPRHCISCVTTAT